MDPLQIRFDDGASYEAYMGKWSQIAGDRFLRWLAPRDGWRWVDVGCGNGAFTELIVERCRPVSIDGIDPSDAQIAYATDRFPDRPVRFRVGDATDLPYVNDTFDAAVMALVIFFVLDAPKGVTEMARVVRPGGSVSAYAWDIVGGGFPFVALQDALLAVGLTPLRPPNIEAATLENLRAMWSDAGLVDLRTDVIRVQRTFDDFESFWSVARTGPRLAPRIDAMSADAVDEFRDELRRRLTFDADGRVICDGVANAIEGRVPG